MVGRTIAQSRTKSQLIINYDIFFFIEIYFQSLLTFLLDERSPLFECLTGQICNLDGPSNFELLTFYFVTLNYRKFNYISNNLKLVMYQVSVLLTMEHKDCETHYRGEGFLFLTKSIKTQKE